MTKGELNTQALKIGLAINRIAMMLDDVSLKTIKPSLKEIEEGVEALIDEIEKEQKNDD